MLDVKQLIVAHKQGATILDVVTGWRFGHYPFINNISCATGYLHLMRCIVIVCIRFVPRLKHIPPSLARFCIIFIGLRLRISLFVAADAPVRSSTARTVHVCERMLSTNQENTLRDHSCLRIDVLDCQSPMCCNRPPMTNRLSSYGSCMIGSMSGNDHLSSSSCRWFQTQCLWIHASSAPSGAIFEQSVGDYHQVVYDSIASLSRIHHPMSRRYWSLHYHQVVEHSRQLFASVSTHLRCSQQAKRSIIWASSTL